ncbi:MAG: GWxTD domain-containing protein [Acidobacteriaceae bacterium]|nr:GWxTD domain-containing protein [Acidobacteriaceae bacterium]
MNQRLPRFALLLGALLLVFSSIAQAASTKNLAPQYKHWINEEVTYIISTNEKKQFLALTTDVERDNFIKSFWEARNPNPGSSSNSYKEEHYRRLAYANATYGNTKAQDGWRTDQGQIYITLGAPQQKMKYQQGRNVRAMEVWFYQSPTPALPAHFYVLFYKRSIGEAFSLYSPYQDGPNRLVTGLEGKNEQKNSLDIIERALGKNMAHIALSLIPTERTDITDYQPTLESDALLASIKGLADNPYTIQHIEEMKASERVTASVLTGRNQADLMYDIVRDDHGRLTLNYLLHNRQPDPKFVGALPDGTQGYSVTLRASVATEKGQQVYTQEDVMTGQISAKQNEAMERKTFGAEGRLPLAAGTYAIAFTLTNNLNHEATINRKTFTVVAPKPGSFGMSELLAYTAPAPVKDPEDKMPFDFAHLRFPPRGAQIVTLHAGEKLPIAFQIWMPPAATSDTVSHTVHLHYVFGNVAANGSEAPNVDDEDVQANNLDGAGNLLTGHTLDTSELQPGHYRLVVKATDQTTKQTAFATLNFEVYSEDIPVDTWTVYGPGPAHGLAEDDVRRGLAAAAMGRVGDAEAWYRRALVENPTYQPALTRLAESLTGRGDLAALVALSQQGHQVAEPQAVVLIADAMRKSERGKEAIKFMTEQMALQAPSALLDTKLAEAYDEQGDHSRAQEYRQQAKSLQ